MDNYEKQVYTGRELFLKYDQDKLIKKYGLKHDEEYLYLKYIGTEYRINRRNGAIEYATGCHCPVRGGSISCPEQQRKS